MFPVLKGPQKAQEKKKPLGKDHSKAHQFEMIQYLKRAF